MKKNLLLVLLVVSVTVWSQQLAPIYKGGEIRLTPDAEYAKNIDWNKLFPDYNQTAGSRAIGLYKQIVVAPDGSVFMSHRTRHSITKFDKNGNFMKEFGKKGGKNPSDFIYMPSVEGILDGKYLYTTAVDGRMHFFDLNGLWVKTIKLKYMPLGSIPLKGGKIALLGYVPYKGEQSRNMVSLLNFADGKEKVITSEFEPYGTEKKIIINPIMYTDDTGKVQKGPMISCSLPLADPMYSRVRLATTTTGNLVTAHPETGEIIIYSPNGQKIKQFKADVKPDVITKEDREGFYQKAAKQVSNLETDVTDKTRNKAYWVNYIAQYKQQLEKFRDPANYPSNLPYFSEMMVDSENNILLFRFTREEGSNKFDVYTYNSQGTKIATSTFIADNYDVKINPSVFKFHNGSIYSFVKLKGATGNPMRLVKFDLKKNSNR